MNTNMRINKTTNINSKENKDGTYNIEQSIKVNLELYKIFKVVVERASFSGAAKALFISQPAVSQAINQLEKQLNVILFRRMSKGVMLTSEGQVLYNYIDSGLKLIWSGENKLLQMTKLLCGEIKISAGDTISKHYLLPLLEKFNNQYPDIKVKVINRTSRASIELLKSGEVDIAFASLPTEDPAIKTKPCLKVHDILVAGQKYKEIAENVLSYKDITNYPLIMLENSSSSRKFIDRYFIKQGVILEPEIELGSHDLLLEFAKIGLGVSCVVKEFSNEYLSLNQLYEIELEKSIPSREIGLCFLRDVPLSLAAKSFVNMING